MPAKQLGCVLIVLACLAPGLVAASEDRFTCNAPSLFGKAPCGKESYEVPDKGVLRIKLDKVEHNFCLKIDAVDAASNKNVASGVSVCAGGDALVWANHTGATFTVKLQIQADDWSKIFGEDGLTGTVVIGE
jgi:hypothetical protein